MKITPKQLRKIIREEISRATLHEARRKPKRTKENDPRLKVYPDTREGALAMLGDLFALNGEPVSVRRDPSVKGVYEVIVDPALNDGVERWITYLAGYEDSWGQIRKFNDAEEEYAEDEW